MIYLIKLEGAVDVGSDPYDIFREVGQWLVRTADSQQGKGNVPSSIWDASCKPSLEFFSLEHYRQKLAEKALKKAEQAEPAPNRDAWKTLLMQWKDLVNEVDQLRPYKLKLEEICGILYMRGWEWLTQSVNNFLAEKKYDEQKSEEIKRDLILQAFEYAIHKTGVDLEFKGFLMTEDPSSPD